MDGDEGIEDDDNDEEKHSAILNAKVAPTEWPARIYFRVYSCGLLSFGMVLPLLLSILSALVEAP